MKKQSCSACGSAVFFENSVCLHCGTNLGYLGSSARSSRWTGKGGTGTPRAPSGTSARTFCSPAAPGLPRRAAASASAATSRVPVPTTATPKAFRSSLWLSGPNASSSPSWISWACQSSPARRIRKGLAFDLLSSVNENVVIGHAAGIITIDLAESDDAYRERMRAQLDEPYRTMLGHFRHEVGHYFEDALVFSSDELTREARDLFGDDTKDYQAEIDRHYSEGAPADWEQRYISRYATMHPYEDFAESFAHYLHICDTIDTAREFGLISKYAGDLVVPRPRGNRMAAALGRPEPGQPEHGKGRSLPVRPPRRGDRQARVRPRAPHFGAGRRLTTARRLTNRPPLPTVGGEHPSLAEPR